MSNYDYAIIGAGPCGIALAYALSLSNKRIILIDRNSSLGGIHRVTRVQGLFTEHGPRIYSNSYVNTIELFNDMNIKIFISLMY
jgi:cation diffusion facilitator CzcD-associated flavoprotein CzcO